jgi:hypothetical protein
MKFLENCVNQGVACGFWYLYGLAECRAAGLNSGRFKSDELPTRLHPVPWQRREALEVGFVIGDGPPLIAGTQGTIAAQVSLADGDDSIAEC